MANNDNTIHILEEHKVYKKEYDDGWVYFGEMDDNKKPMNIGLFYCNNYNLRGSFMMMENVTGKYNGEGMCINKNTKDGTCSVGYCYNGKQMGPQFVSDKKGNLGYCSINEKGVRSGFAIDVLKNKYTIYQCDSCGNVGYKGVTYEDGILYFEDFRRREDNKYSRIFDSNEKYFFSCGDGLVVDDFDYKKAIMPTKVIKKDAKHFVVSGGVQTYKEGIRIKSEYNDYFKEIGYGGSFPSGYGIKYYDDAYFFGQFDNDGKRVKAGCLRKNNIAFMGNLYKDAFYGPVLTIEDGITRFCSYDNGKKHGTYFEIYNDCLFIKNRYKDKDHNIAYKIELNTFVVEEIDLSTNKVLRSAMYPFYSDDKESLRQQEEQGEELDELEKLGLTLNDFIELSNFKYSIENGKVKILSLIKPIKHIAIPNCASLIADNAFTDEVLCKDVLSVNVHDGVEIIGENCFNGCKKLANIYMGKKVKEIKKGAFNGSLCDYVFFPDSTKMIRTEAFAGCENLREVHVSDDCVIEEGAFPEWTKILTRKDQNKRIKKTIRQGNPFFKVIYFIGGIFKKKKKSKMVPGVEKKLKEHAEEVNKNKSKKVKDKNVKKAVKQYTNDSFGERIQGILRILALPFILLAKGVSWFFSWIFKGIKSLFGGIKDFLADIEITKEHILMVLPFVILLGYTIFSFVYGVDKLEDISVTKLIYDGYDWEISGWASNWMEETDHNFFTAITLGLIQILLIVIGFVLDIVLAILIFVIGLVLAILAGILKFIVMELLPLAVLAIYLIKLKFVSNSDEGLLVTCMILSLVMGVLYYIVLLA